MRETQHSAPLLVAQSLSSLRTRSSEASLAVAFVSADAWTPSLIPLRKQWQPPTRNSLSIADRLCQLTMPV